MRLGVGDVHAGGWLAPTRTGRRMQMLWGSVPGYTAHAPRHTTAGYRNAAQAWRSLCPRYLLFLFVALGVDLYYMHLCAQVYEDFGAAVEPGVTAGQYHTREDVCM